MADNEFDNAMFLQAVWLTSEGFHKPKHIRQAKGISLKGNGVYQNETGKFIVHGSEIA